MRHPSRGVMRVRPLVLLATAPLLGVFVVGIAWGVVDAISRGDIGYPFRSSHLGGAGITIGWTIAGVLGLASFLGLLLLVRLRVAITPDGFDARAYFRHHRLTLAQVTGVEVSTGTPYPTTQPKFPGIEVRARDAVGRRRGFQLSSVHTGTDRAMPVFGAWVRNRPELVRDEATRATFAAWGVDLPTPAAETAPADPQTFLRTDNSSFTTDGHL